MDDATLSQVIAADPALSTWLAANAGSGKTRVLTDRVARLLLRGTPPQRILCLTYTKAAASEMQNRLFQRLGKWAMLPDALLSDELRALGEDVVAGSDLLARARRLFARAIETPGGLKIQTIHAFCSAVLRRFPLEAAVSPDFAEAEERSLQQLRIEVLDRLAQGPEAAILSDLLTRLSEDAFVGLMQDLGQHRDRFSGPMPDFHTLFDLPPGYDEDRLLAEAFDGDELDLFARLIAKLLTSGSNDQKLARVLAGILSLNLAAVRALEGKLLYGEGAKAGPFAAKCGKIVTKPLHPAIGPDDLAALDALAQRIEGVRERRMALESLRAAQSLHRFARLWLPAFDDAKQARGWLNFDDLIRLTRQLLGRSSVAQWVLFKLDGGIDHILVDEAQDTSPEQWRVIDLLTQEFAAGQGARHDRRTIFVVGDRKQSIYSFQGADLQGFETVHAAFRQRFEQSGQGLAEAELTYSFRSSDAVLRLVDHCFAPARGRSGLGGGTEHLAFHLSRPGRVDLWPAVARPEKDPEQRWDDPLDRPAQSHEDITLARTIAQEIRAMIDRGEQIDRGEGPRAVHEGDFLILVRRRKLLFNALIRECKAQGLEIAGADRLHLSEELAVQDLIALLRFLALPEDDLSLAVALRSPLFGWGEDQLYRLAQGRGGQFLWEALRNAPSGDAARAVLDDLRAQVDFLRPYELIERVLTRHGGRRRIRARFGVEVDEALEAFVDLALVHEQGRVPSLDGFLGWLDASDAEVKRQSESAGRRVRVMTVHGAKGLEAPIVILPDTAARKPPPPPAMIVADGVPILRSTKDSATVTQTAADAAAALLRDEESGRLLYVALTRAESWLIVTGAGNVDDPASWYARVAAGMAGLAPVALQTALGQGWRHQHGVWPAATGLAGDDGSETVDQPLVLEPVPPAPAREMILSPTALGGAKALAGDGAESDIALARGDRIHRLLEHLPLVPADRRGACGNALLGQWAGTAEGDLCLTEALTVLADPALAALFDGDALVEVALSGIWNGRAMQGQIDRLLIGARRVLAVDFKTNREVPRDGATVPEGLLRQMGAYAHLLRALYPGRTVETALLWTAGPRLMMLNPDALRAALDRAALDPAVTAS